MNRDLKMVLQFKHTFKDGAAVEQRFKMVLQLNRDFKMVLQFKHTFKDSAAVEQRFQDGAAV